MMSDKSVRPSIKNQIGGIYKQRRDAARNNRALDATWKLIVLVVGMSLLGLGIFFLLFPGPGWATIILGLIVLASEYSWANSLLHPVKRFTSAMALKIMSDEYKQRRMHIALSTSFLLIVVLYAYWNEWGLTLDGLRAMSSALLGL
jgi:uncharacterized protein (TIGR02611 family)